MKVGMTLPVTEPGWTRNTLEAWCRNIESGPYHSLALGERLCFPSPEIIATLSACAALTKRVKLHTTVIVLPIHDPVVLAKQLATIDVFSEGRLIVGVGSGGREEDYHASNTPLDRKRLAVMDEQVATMRRVWAGEKVRAGTLRPVEPFPLQEGGPPILAGVFGPKGMASAAHWSAGLAGMSMSGQVSEAVDAFATFRQIWADQGGSTAPYLTSSFWFALGANADAQVETHLQRYFNWLDDNARKAMAESCGFRGSVQALTDRLKQFRDAGCDELLLIPTSIDPDEVNRAAEAVAAL